MVMAAPTATNTGIRPMTTDTRFLTLAQWLSPAYPVGSFAFSHGLETAISAGIVSDSATLQAWLTDLLTDGSGRADAVWLRRAYDAAADDIAALDQDARAYAASAERLREGLRQGAAFVQVTNAVWGLDLPPLLLPLAVGRAARLQGMDAQMTAALYLHSFASNLVSAAVRLVPLGQTEGQAVLAALTPLCEQVAADADGADIWSNAFLSDIAAMRHETQEPRLFQS